MKKINPSLIGNFENIDYPARRQFPSDEIVEKWKSRGHLYVNYTGLLREEYRGVPQWCHDIVPMVAWSFFFFFFFFPSPLSFPLRFYTVVVPQPHRMKAPGREKI